MFLNNIWKVLNQDIQSPRIIRMVQFLVGLTVGLVFYGILWHFMMYIELTFLDGTFYLKYYNTVLWKIGEGVAFVLLEVLGVWVTFKTIRLVERKKR